MVACFGPRRLLVGWSSSSAARHWNACLKSSVQAAELLPARRASGICVRSSCGVGASRTFGGIVGSRLHNGCPRAAHLDTETINEPLAIDIIVIGTNQCTLCSKALLSVRRIISSLSPPLVYERLSGCAPSAWPLATRARAAWSPGKSNLGFETKSREGGVVTALGNSAGRGGAYLASEAPILKERLPAVSSSYYNGPQPESISQEDQRGSCYSRSPQGLLQLQAQVQVRVRVGLASLDSAEARESLGICEGDAQHLREEVPIVLVGGEPVSRLKFNGPAVRAALLQGLKSLQAGPLQALRVPGTSN